MFYYTLNAVTLFLAVAVYTTVLAWGDWIVALIGRKMFPQFPENSLINLFLQSVVITLITLAILLAVARNTGDVLGIDYLTLLPNGKWKQD